MEKSCARCNQTLPLNAFGSNKTTKDGLQFYCRDCVRDYSRARRANGANEARKVAARALRRETVEFMGGKCQCCGVDDYRVLEIDHTNGGGHQERQKLLREVFWRQILAGRTDVQLLCANCHRIKSYFPDEACH